MPNKPLIGPYRLDPFQSQIVTLEWGEAAPPGDGVIILGRAQTIRFSAATIQWNATGPDEPNENDQCRYFDRFDLGDPGFFSRLNMQQYDPGDVPIGIGEEPSHTEIHNYTFIGDTSLVRWRPSDFAPFVCEKGSTQFISARSSAGGASPVPGLGTLGDFSNAFQPPTFLVQMEMASLDAARHPNFIQGEGFTAYPPGRVPP